MSRRRDRDGGKAAVQKQQQVFVPPALFDGIPDALLTGLAAQVDPPLHLPGAFHPRRALGLKLPPCLIQLADGLISHPRQQGRFIARVERCDRLDGRAVCREGMYRRRLLLDVDEGRVVHTASSVCAKPRSRATSQPTSVSVTVWPSLTM